MQAVEVDNRTDGPPVSCQKISKAAAALLAITLCGVPESALTPSHPDDACECGGPPTYGDGQRFYCDQCAPLPLRRAVAVWLLQLVAATPDSAGLLAHGRSN